MLAQGRMPWLGAIREGGGAEAGGTERPPQSAVVVLLEGHPCTLGDLECIGLVALDRPRPCPFCPPACTITISRYMPCIL